MITLVQILQLIVQEAEEFIPARGWKKFDPKGSVVLSIVFDDEPRTLTSEQVGADFCFIKYKLTIAYI